MMEHHMSIYHAGFECITTGKQKIEVRINDEKRRKVQIGDTIVLTRKPEGDEVLDLEVIGLSHFATFEDMFSSIDPERFGWPKDIKVSEQVRRMHEYYTADEERRYGVVAIHIRLLARRVLK